MRKAALLLALFACSGAAAMPIGIRIAISGAENARNRAAEPDPETLTYTVAFDANGGNGSMTKQTMVCGEATALQANGFAFPGHVFLGWATSKAGAVDYADGAVVTDLAAAGGSVMLWAQWAVEQYTVKFKANGGKGKMAAQTLTWGKAAKLRRDVFTRSGYVFIGWALKKNGAVAYKNAQRVKNLREDGGTVTLYAKWAKKTYRMQFIANGGTGKMAVEKFTYGKAKKLSANKFKRSGYTFAGWAKSKADAKKGKVAYKNKKKVKNLTTTGKTVKLYAVWKKK